jgi:hypothetical protein
VLVGIKHCVDAIDLGVEKLFAEVDAGVDQDASGFDLAVAKTFDEKGAAAAAVSGVMRIANSPIVAYARHAAGRTAA